MAIRAQFGSSFERFVLKRTRTNYIYLIETMCTLYTVRDINCTCICDTRMEMTNKSSFPFAISGFYLTFSMVVESYAHFFGTQIFILVHTYTHSECKNSSNGPDCSMSHKNRAEPRGRERKRRIKPTFQMYHV